MKIRLTSPLRPLKTVGILLIIILQTTGSSDLMAQVWTGTTLEINDATLGSNGDYTAFYRADPYGDYTQLRLRMGDEQTSLFEIGYNFYQNGQWIQNFSLDGDGNAYVKGNLGIGTAATQRLDVLGRMKFRSYSGSSAGAWYTDEAGNQAAFIGMLGPSSSDAIGIWHGNAWRLNVNPTGNVGMGTITPNGKLHIYKTTTGNGEATLAIDGPGNSERSIVFRDEGSDAWWFGRDNNGDLNSGIGFWRSGVGFALGIRDNGNVGIGTTNPDYKLTVKGKIHAEEVKVDLSVPGPDYVFDPDYQLTSLDELKQYIDQHKHLPEIPSANQMEEDGINLMEMNMLLLKKVEELTLYVIELKEEIKVLKSKHD